MNEYERQVLQSLQFLVAIQKPRSQAYQDEQSKILTKNILLLSPIKLPTIRDKTHDALSQSNDEFREKANNEDN